jgi:hypothetical protein
VKGIDRSAPAATATSDSAMANTTVKMICLKLPAEYDRKRKQDVRISRRRLPVLVVVSRRSEDQTMLDTIRLWYIISTGIS